MKLDVQCPTALVLDVGRNEKYCPLTGSNDRPRHYEGGKDHQITSDDMILRLSRDRGVQKGETGHKEVNLRTGEK